MRHGHASLGLQARPGVGARVRRLGQGPGLGLAARERLYYLDLLDAPQDYYSRDPILKFWDPLHISGTVAARNSKFGMQMDPEGN